MIECIQTCETNHNNVITHFHAHTHAGAKECLGCAHWFEKALEIGIMSLTFHLLKIAVLSISWVYTSACSQESRPGDWSCLRGHFPGFSPAKYFIRFTRLANIIFFSFLIVFLKWRLKSKLYVRDCGVWRHDCVHIKGHRTTKHEWILYWGKQITNEVSLVIHNSWCNWSKPSLKIGTTNVVCWNYLGLFRDYCLDHIISGIKLFCFSRYKAEIFSICLKKKIVKPPKISIQSDNW